MALQDSVISPARFWASWTLVVACNWFVAQTNFSRSTFTAVATSPDRVTPWIDRLEYKVYFNELLRCIWHMDERKCVKDFSKTCWRAHMVDTQSSLPKFYLFLTNVYSTFYTIMLNCRYITQLFIAILHKYVGLMCFMMVKGSEFSWPNLILGDKMMFQTPTKQVLS